MYYHCRALEVLAPALLHIGGVNAESAREVGYDYYCCVGYRSQPARSPLVTCVSPPPACHTHDKSPRLGEPVRSGRLALRKGTVFTSHANIVVVQEESYWEEKQRRPTLLFVGPGGVVATGTVEVFRCPVSLPQKRLSQPCNTLLLGPIQNNPPHGKPWMRRPLPVGQDFDT